MPPRRSSSGLNASPKKPRQAHTLHRRRGRSTCGSASCSRPRPTDSTSLHLSIEGKAPMMTLTFGEIKLPSSRPSTAEPLADWQASIRQTEPPRQYMPFEPTTEMGRRAMAAMSGDTGLRKEEAAPACSETPGKGLPVRQQMRPKSAPAGRSRQQAPPTPKVASSEISSFFVGGLPNAIKLNYEKLDQNLRKVKNSLPFDECLCRSASTVEPTQSARLRRRGLEPHGASSLLRQRPQSALVAASSASKRAVETKPRPRSACALVDRKQRTGLPGRSDDFDPSYILDILGAGVGAAVNTLRYENKMRTANAKTYAFQ